MNTPFQTDPQQQQDRALLDDFQRELIIKMRERLNAPDLDNADLCKFADKCATFQKIALSRDRLVAYERRTDAMYHIAQGRKDTQLEIARLRAEAARAKLRPDHPHVDDDDDLAPWGRKKDGTPYTHEEFKQSLNEAIRDIWGLPPVNPNSYMPWEKRPDPDDSPIRARSASDGSPSRSPSEGESRGEGPTARNSPLEDVDSAREPSPSRDPFVIRNSSFAITTGSSSSQRETAPARCPSEDG